jgi:hypothetical protein
MNDGEHQADRRNKKHSHLTGPTVERQPAQTAFDGTLGVSRRCGRAHLQAVPRGDDIRTARAKGWRLVFERAFHRVV